MTAITEHRLGTGDLTMLATGRGNADLIRRLREVQVSRRLLQLRALMMSARALPACDVSELRAGYELAADVQECDSRLVADVLMYPSVGIWVAHCLRRLRGTVSANQPLSTDFGHLAAIAAAAAARAGRDFEIEIPLRDGAITLPTLGVARFPSSMPGDRALVRGSVGVVEVVVRQKAVVVPLDRDTDTPGWQGLRWLSASFGPAQITVALDDIDPFRAAPDLPSADRLTDSELRWWRRVFDRAWVLLASRHPDYAKAISAGLVMLTPLDDYAGHASMSATCREAFGACSLSKPSDAQSLAVTLVHEFQHAKLGALHDLSPLYTRGSHFLVYSPWRDDPRPLNGLLQGAYAYLGVTDFWRSEMVTGGSGGQGYAGFEFTRWRNQTLAAISVIERSGHLSPSGCKLVAGMRCQLNDWLADPVPIDSTTAATKVIADHRLSWRMRNLRPDPVSVATLAESWLAHGRPHIIRATPAIIPSDRALAGNPRIDLLCEKASGHVSLSQAESIDAIHTANLAYVRGEHRTAAHQYHKLIMSSSDRRDAWAGLVLAGNWPRQSIMTRAPELVYALHRGIREHPAPSPDPYELVAWLDSVQGWPVNEPEIWPDTY